ncbi:MAG TPA: hypothetical protein VJO52_07535 [Gemmatimonadaceae bacterium]|nr:hypothetical protein [Gemmatimonadaceae bacterium]
MQYRYVGVMVAALAALGCSNLTDSSGVAAAAGSYDTFFSTTMSAPTISGSATLPQTLGTISLGKPAGNGTFSGSFSITGNGGSGTVAGTMASGGAVTISHFGDPSRSPLQSVAFLETLMPSCDFTQAVSGAMSGAVQNGKLALTGALTLPCSWTSGGSTVVVPTVATVQMSGSQD